MSTLQPLTLSTLLICASIAHAETSQCQSRCTNAVATCEAESSSAVASLQSSRNQWADETAWRDALNHLNGIECGNRQSTCVVQCETQMARSAEQQEKKAAMANAAARLNRQAYQRLKAESDRARQLLQGRSE